MWTNWAGNQTSSAEIRRPANLSELQAMVAGARSLRVLGAGHSFTPLIRDADHIMQLDRIGLSPVRDADEDGAWLNANARLKALSPALGEVGLAFRNLGDINAQSLAGATATATHGTGETLQCLSAEIRDVRMMTASGDIVSVEDMKPQFLQAAQVSLGLLGVMIEARVALVPKYNLHRRVSLVPLEDAISGMHDNWSGHRNFEFFVIPWTGKAIELRHELSDRSPGKPPKELDNLAVRVLRLARNAGRIHPSLRRALLSLLVMAQSDEDYVGESWQVLCSQRDIPFIEMEYHLPPENAQDALKEVIERTETRFPSIYFPIEVRKTAGDTAWLSPFQGGPRVSIAIHASPRDRDEGYFANIESIFRSAGGRPHWGKMHSLTMPDLESLYPDFGSFLRLRQDIDPKGKFLTPSLRRLFDGAAGS